MTYSSDVAITVNGFAAAVFGGLGSIRLALLGGYALGILEQLVVGYVDPQYSLIIALIVMLVLIGWRSRAEIASASHDAHAAIRRARVPWPAPVRIGLILAGAVFACWLPYQLSTFDVALYDRMGLYALVTIGLTLLMGYAGQISLGQGAFFLIGAYTSAILTVGHRPRHPLRRSRGRRFAGPRRARGARRRCSARRGDRRAAAAPARSLPRVRDARAAPHRLLASSPPGTGSRAVSTGSRSRSRSPYSGTTCAARCTQPSSGRSLRSRLLLATNLVHSRVGRALQAIATDEASAAASGIPVASYKLRLFVFAAALAGLGGGLFTFAFLIVSPEAFPIVLSIEFVVMVAVGGLGNIYGAVVGTVAILYLEQKLRDLGTRPDLFGWDLPDAAPTVFSFGVFGLILMAIMLFFPRGLLPAVGDATAGVWSRGSAAPAGGALLRQPQQPGGVLLEDERSHVVSEVGTREVLEPVLLDERPAQYARSRRSPGITDEMRGSRSRVRPMSDLRGGTPRSERLTDAQPRWGDADPPGRTGTNRHRLTPPGHQYVTPSRSQPLQQEQWASQSGRGRNGKGFGHSLGPYLA